RLFFFSSRRRHTRFSRDWSSDVCSSDLTRGQEDRKIPVQVWEAYSEGMHCNGNGLCYSWNPNDAMCPSWKGTRERKHSPKGRASLMREWLTQMSDRNIHVVDETKKIRSSSFLFNLPQRAFNSFRKNKGDYDF